MNIKLLVLLISIGIYSSFLMQNSKKDDKVRCSGQSDANKCKLVQLTSNDLQCCQISFTIIAKNGNKLENKTCSTDIKPFDASKEYYNSKQGQAHIRESFGYSTAKKFGENFFKISEFNFVIDCNDGFFNKNIGISEYDNDDYSILSSDQYCLKYYNTDGLASEDICLNSKLLKKSVDIGLTCGYFEYHVKTNGRTTIYRTCNIFDRNTYNTKKFDNVTKDEVESFVYSDLNLDYESFEVYITGVKNKQLVYFSSNSSIVYDGPGEEIEPISTDSSNFISIKYLFALCLLLLF